MALLPENIVVRLLIIAIDKVSLAYAMVILKFAERCKLFLFQVLKNQPSSGLNPHPGKMQINEPIAYICLTCIFTNRKGRTFFLSPF